MGFYIAILAYTQSCLTLDVTVASYFHCMRVHPISSFLSLSTKRLEIDIRKEVDYDYDTRKLDCIGNLSMITTMRSHLKTLSLLRNHFSHLNFQAA